MATTYNRPLPGHSCGQRATIQHTPTQTNTGALQKMKLRIELKDSLGYVTTVAFPNVLLEMLQWLHSAGKCPFSAAQ